MKKRLSTFIEWIRPIGIVTAFFLADEHGIDAIAKFHYIGLITVLVMSGTTAMDTLFFGDAHSEKIGYKPERSFEIQSACSMLATTLTGLLLFIENWGLYADVTIVIWTLLFFAFSSVNHAFSAIRNHNMKPVTVMRPVMTVALLSAMIPVMIQALSQR